MLFDFLLLLLLSICFAFAFTEASNTLRGLTIGTETSHCLLI